MMLLGVQILRLMKSDQDFELWLALDLSEHEAKQTHGCKRRTYCGYFFFLGGGGGGGGEEGGRENNSNQT